MLECSSKGAWRVQQQRQRKFLSDSSLVGGDGGGSGCLSTGVRRQSVAAGGQLLVFRSDGDDPWIQQTVVRAEERRI